MAYAGPPQLTFLSSSTYSEALGGAALGPCAAALAACLASLAFTLGGVTGRSLGTDACTPKKLEPGGTADRQLQRLSCARKLVAAEGEGRVAGRQHREAAPQLGSSLCTLPHQVEGAVSPVLQVLPQAPFQVLGGDVPGHIDGPLPTRLAAQLLQVQCCAVSHLQTGNLQK